MRSSVVVAWLSRLRLSAICLLVAVIKLVLVSKNEILCLQDDSATYARQVIAPWTLGFPPGYPLWLKLCTYSGLPQRICIELLYLLAAYLVAIAAQRLLGLLPGALCFTFLAIAPFSFFLFDHGLSDVFYAVLTLLAFGLTMTILLAKTLPGTLFAGASLGFVFGVMSFTRNEDPLVLLWMFLLLLSCVIAWCGGLSSLKQFRFWRRPIAVVAVVGFCCAALIFCVCYSYLQVNGVFARGLAVMPEHSKLLRNLASIETDQPPTRYVSISRKSREMAYAVSPTLAKYASPIEDQNDVWHRASRQSGLPPGEIGTGWIWHTFTNKVLPTVKESPEAVEGIFKQANSELNRAFQDGRLRKRFIIHPLLGGDLAGLLHQLPHSIGAVASAALSALPPDNHDDGLETALFDKAFLRRSALEEGPKVTVEGWAFVPAKGRKIFDIVISSDVTASARVETVKRQDVLNVFTPQFGWPPEVSGFRSDLKSSFPQNVSITYLLDNGTQVQVPHMAGTGITKLSNPASPESAVLQGIDVLTPHDLVAGSFLHRKQLQLVKNSNSVLAHWIAIVIFLGTGLFLMATAARKYDIEYIRLPGIILALAFVLWCARVLFYSVLDAAAWQADQIRYLAATNAIGVVILALSVSVLLSFGMRSIIYRLQILE